VVSLAAVTLMVPMLGFGASPASADTAPETPGTLPTVSADALPTVQINGVVWDQVIVGDTVYATGEFTSARPAGSPAGTNEVLRSNILAYSLSTGTLNTSWTPSLNAQGTSIVASPDGSRIFVSGSFTQVDNVNRYRVVGLDATSGAIVSGWNVVADSRVRSLAISGDTLYMGGIFSTVNSQPRERLAAVSASTGALLSWAPTADAEVLALTAPAGSGKVVAGGKFANVNSTGAYGMAALDATSGQLLPWPIGAVVRDAGDNAGIYSLRTDGAQVYGTGYTFGTGGNFEGTFAASAGTGALVWVNGCLGDTYDSVPIGGVLYNVSHAHNCSYVGANPEVSPRNWQRAQAETTTQGPNNAVNHGGTFNGRPAPEVLHWLPTFVTGTYTGAGQAAWTVEGNASYITLGGEFTKVNSTAQQGLVRFAIKSIAPNKQGPQGGSEMTPAITGIAAGTVRVTWKAAWDRDNRNLTYTVLRGPTLASSVPVVTFSRDSAWWNRPNLSFTDYQNAGGSTQTYRIQVKDALGNVVNSSPASGTVPTGAIPATTYPDAIRSDGATSYWRLHEASGTGYDWGNSTNDLIVASDVTRSVAGAIVNDADTAMSFPGSGSAPAVAGLSISAPQTFTEEAWFKTASTQGGKIIGFGSNRTGGSSVYDRHVYLTNTGRVVFGVYNGTVQVITSAASYNNGRWHHVAASLSSAGMQLYLDGQLAGTNPATTAQTATGYWRIGGDTISNSWPNKPNSDNLAGTIDEVAVYPTALSQTKIQQHVQLGLGLVTNLAPTAAFTSSATGLTASFNGSGSHDPDGTIASYAWDFGDGSSGTGATPSRTYVADGTYQVALTVTDNGGATDSVTQPVTVAAVAAGTTVAADAFGRSVASGWGSADIGGAWTLSASGSTLSVADDSGRASVPAGRTMTAKLNMVQNQDTDLTTQVWSENAVTGGGTYLSAVVRSTSGGDYRTRVKILSTGVVQSCVTSVIGTTETALSTTVTVPGVTYTAGAKLMIRVQASGSQPTTIRYRVWLDGTTEPTGWLQSVTDGTAALQGGGAVGVVGYVSSSATAAGILRFDNLSAAQL
jgi:PKD repeat protein